MNPLFVDSIVSNVHVRHNCLEIASPKRNKIFYFFKYREIPYDALIINCNNGMITYDAITWLKEHSVSTTILDWDGSILAQILPDERNNGELRLSQYDAYNSREMKLSIVKNIVQCKISRQHDLLKQLSQWYDLDVPSIPVIETTSPDFIRNIEARYANEYFVQFGKVCNDLCYGFKVRSSNHGNK